MTPTKPGDAHAGGQEGSMTGTSMNPVSDTTTIDEPGAKRDDELAAGRAMKDRHDGRLEAAVDRAVNDLETEGRILWSPSTPTETT